MSAALYRRQVMSSEALVTTDESGRPLGRPTGLGGSSSAMPIKHVSFDDGSSPTSPTSEIYTAAVPANASKSTERLLETRSTGGRSVETLISSGLPPACGRPPPSQHQQQQASFSPVLARAILLGKRKKKLSWMNKLFYFHFIIKVKMISSHQSNQLTWLNLLPDIYTFPSS